MASITLATVSPITSFKPSNKQQPPRNSVIDHEGFFAGLYTNFGLPRFTV
ncbi:MAG: hypothetical protein QX199_17060 [Methylococcaceae bacterium]